MNRHKPYGSRLGPYLYLLPSILIFGIFLFYPFFKTIYLSFYKTNKLGQAKLFVGIGNYLELLKSSSFRNSLQVTILFVLIVVLISMLLGLIGAVLCNKTFPGIRFFSTAYALPMAIASSSAAMIDGCPNLTFIFRILLPLTKSAIGAMAVYTFINAWNMYMWPLLVTGSDKMRTVQIGISMLNSVDAQSITLMIAGVVMIILPSISIFIVGQKQLIRGMFSGAVKG